ncbi:MAG: hypothetical protein ABII82_09850 [Verrucomicrobiota bacterium]
MKNLGRILAVFVVAAVLSGCQSTPEKRIAKNQTAFESMPAEVQLKIRKGEVAVGFTEQQVRLAKGEPDRIGRRTTGAGESVVWTYEKRSGGLGFGLGIGGGSGGLGGGVGVSTGGGRTDVDARVVFEGGVVTAVENRER